MKKYILLICILMLSQEKIFAGDTNTQTAATPGLIETPYVTPNFFEFDDEEDDDCEFLLPSINRVPKSEATKPDAVYLLNIKRICAAAVIKLYVYKLWLTEKVHHYISSLKAKKNYAQ